MFLAFLSSSPPLRIACMFHAYMFSVSFRAPLVYESFIEMFYSCSCSSSVLVYLYCIIFSCSFILPCVRLHSGDGVESPRPWAGGLRPSAAWPASCVTGLRPRAPVSHRTVRDCGGPSPSPPLVSDAGNLVRSVRLWACLGNTSLMINLLLWFAL